MNLQLGDQTIPMLIGTLDPGYPLLTGTLDTLAPLMGGTLESELVHDLVLSDGNVPLYTGLDQRIDCALRTVFGEWWLDRSEGVRYFEELLKKNPDMSVARQIFASVISEVPGVQSITKLETKFQPSTRTFRVDFEVKGTDAIPASGISEVLV